MQRYFDQILPLSLTQPGERGMRKTDTDPRYGSGLIFFSFYIDKQQIYTTPVTDIYISVNYLMSCCFMGVEKLRMPHKKPALPGGLNTKRMKFSSAGKERPENWKLLAKAGS